MPSCSSDCPGCSDEIIAVFIDEYQLTLFHFQILIKMLQTPDLTSSCCRTLLNTISAFLLAENVFLPDSLTKEAIEKVRMTAAYSRNHRVQVP